MVDTTLPTFDDTVAAIPQAPVESSPVTDQAPTTDVGINADQTSQNAKDFANYDATHSVPKAILLGAARGLSFGLSDQALVHSGAVDADTLQSIKDNNKVASVAGEIGGIIAPGILAPGSVISRFLGAGVEGAAAARAGVTALTGDALKTIMQATGNPGLAARLIQRSIPAIAGSAVEGGMYGAGQLISENALGSADINAENMLASVGTGALLGGAAGGIFSSVADLIPSAISKGSVLDSIPGVNSVKKYFDPVEASTELLGITGKKLQTLQKSNPDLINDLPNFLYNTAEIKPWTTSHQVQEAIEKVKDASGEKIGDILTQVEDIAQKNPQIMPDRADFYNKIATNLDNNFVKEYSLPNGSIIPEYRSKLNPIIDLRDTYRQMADDSTGKISPLELDGLRRKVADVIKFDKVPGTVSLTEDANRSTLGMLRQSVDDIANSASTDPSFVGDKSLFDQLKEANKNYSTAAAILPSVEGKLTKARMFGFNELLRGNILFNVLKEPGLVIEGAHKLGESDLARKFKIMVSMEAQNQKMGKTVSGAMKGFLSTAPAIGENAVPISTVSLLNSEYSRPDFKGKKPQSAEEAISNIRDNISKLTADPNTLIETIRKNTAQIGDAAPQTQAEMISSTIKALNVISNAIPQDARPDAILNGPYKPSRQEMSNLENVLIAVDDPNFLIKKFQAGKLTIQDAQTLSAVYPNLFENMRNQALDLLSNTKEPITYRKKIQLGNLFGFDVDSSSTIGSLAGLQSSFALPPQQTALTQQKGNLSKLKPKNVSTPLQQVLERD